MIVRISFLASLLVISTLAFECSPDTILRMATNKREKQLERECHEQKTGQNACETKDELEKSWKEFQDVSDQYKEAVAQCRKYVEEKSRPKRSFKDIDSSLYIKEEGYEVDSVFDNSTPDRIENVKSSSTHKRKHKRQDNGDVLDGDMGDPNEGQDTNDHARKRRHHNHEGHHEHDGKHKENMDHQKHEDGKHHGRVRRNGDHDPNDPNVDHTGHNHKVKRGTDDDPNDTTIDHTGHNHRRRRSEDHDPNDPNIDHTGHNHRVRRHNDDPNDTTIDHTGHNHRRRSADDHDPNDPDIDHSGHNHRRRRHNDDPNDDTIDHTGHNHRIKRNHDDPTDDTIDHTGHNHRLRRSGDHDPNDPNIDHTGHNHRRRRNHAVGSRIRRTVCSTAGHDQLSAMSNKFSKHCERENICLPDEDLPKGKQQDDILALQKLRAKKYSEYLTQVSKCYGKL